MEEQTDRVLYEPLTRRKPCGYASETAALLSSARNAWICAAVFAVAFCVSVQVNIQDRKAWRTQQVKFVGIQQDGSLIALDSRMFGFPVTDTTLRSRLLDFVKKHFERVQVRVKEDYAMSEQFLDSALKGERRHTDLPNIKAVLEGQAEEMRLDPLSISLRNIHSGCELVACEASVIVKKTYYRGSAVRSVESTIELEFVVRPKEVTNEMVKADNPMGLVITSLHEYAHFEPDSLGKAALIPTSQP